MMSFSTTDLRYTEDDLRRGFTQILAHVDSLGLTTQQLSTLSSVSDLQDHVQLIRSKHRKHRSCLVLAVYLAVAISVVFISIIFLEWPIGRKDIVAFTFDISRSELVKERCLLELDSVFVNFARPPVDCRICHNLTSVDRVRQLSVEAFETKYAYTGRPVVITDSMANWTAVGTFNFEFFRGIYAEDSPVLTQGDGFGGCQFFPYKSNFRNLSEVFKMSEDRALMRDGSEPWYIGWSNCDSEAANILRAHYTRPYFLPVAAESSRTDWIFMGTPGYGADMHIDNVFNPSWQAQVTGTKQWTLETTPECYLECPTMLEVTVHPGEIIVLDTNQWFHSTRIIGTEMSITIGSEYD